MSVEDKVKADAVSHRGIVCLSRLLAPRPQSIELILRGHLVSLDYDVFDPACQ